MTEACGEYMAMQPDSRSYKENRLEEATEMNFWQRLYNRLPAAIRYRFPWFAKKAGYQKCEIQ